MPAIWDGDLPGLPPARTARHHREHAAEPGPDGPAGGSPAAQGLAPGSKPAPPPPGRPGGVPAVMAGITSPRRAGRPGAKGPSGDRPRTAVSRDVMPRRHHASREARAGIAAGDMRPGAEPLDDDPAARWPAPNPRAARVTSPPGQQASTRLPQAGQPGRRSGQVLRRTLRPAIRRAAERPAVPSADWRDQVLADARQPWQPGPGWPVTRPPLPLRPSARPPSPPSSRTHDPADLHHLVTDGRDMTDRKGSPSPQRPATAT